MARVEFHEKSISVSTIIMIIIKTTHNALQIFEILKRNNISFELIIN